MTNSHEVRLAGPLSLDGFEVVEVPVRYPGPGEVLVRNDWMALTHAMGELLRRPSARLTAATVGIVIASRSAELAAGDLVTHGYGWRGHVTARDSEFTRLDRELLPEPRYFLNPGSTAWRGMAEVANVGSGDTVFVSGAAGAVGSLAGQIARCLGARLVIGSAGSRAKVDYLMNELGYDAAFDYHQGPITARLAELAPLGVDVCFDTAGGEQLEAAVRAAAPGARFALCGTLSGRKPTLELGTRAITLRAFTTSFDPADTHAWNLRFARWLREGRMVFPHTVIEGGPARAPHALISLLKGEFTGSVLLRLS